MLSEEKNTRYTRVGPGTPAGNLLRRYWHPLCPTAEVTPDHPKKRLTLLCEQLVVFHNADGSYSCVAEHCVHRGCSLFYGFLEGRGIRCPYHGWKFDQDGTCLEQPFEPQDSTFKARVRQPAYPVEELGGLLFVYMGPLPAPLLPRWDVLVRTDGQRKVQMRPTIDCNWLQIQENTADTTHTYYLHGHMMAANGRSTTELSSFYYRPIISYDFSYCKWGIEKRCVYGGEFPEEEIRPPLIFPTILRIPEGRNEVQHWRVPIDDTHTGLILMLFTPSADGLDQPPQTTVPIEYIESDFDENGEYRLLDRSGTGAFATQDRMAWETQGAIYDRQSENLGVSDRGIILYRKMLEEQISIVERGGDPIATLRDPAENTIIEFRSHSINRIVKPAEAVNA